MALSLNAEQKSLLKIFKIEEKYIIPAYQRPYSWGYEQCYQLYIDLMNNFKPENELNLNEYPFDDTIVEEKNEQISNEYFLGNIIIAKSEESIFFKIDGKKGVKRYETVVYWCDP